MRSFVIAGLAALSLCGGARAEPPGGSPTAQADSAAKKEFDAVKAEFDKASADYNAAYRAAKTDAERQRLARPNAETYAPRVKAIADKSPKDPAAAECLAWIVQNVRKADVQAEALDGLMANHMASPVLARVCQSLEYCYAANCETFLRRVLEKSQDHEAQGRACYTLARVLNGRSSLAARAKDDAAFAKNLEQWYGKAFAEGLATKDPATLAKDSERLFDRVVSQFADVKYGKGCLADKAKGDLFEIRSLAVGMPAPEIVGEDENGKPIKLSDFRGKAVILDFWGYW